MSSSLRLTRLHEYLAVLPNGLESYPMVRQRASVFRAFIEGTGVRHYVDELPTELAQWVLDPPPQTTWLPEVKATAAYLACADLCFASDRAYEQFAHRANKQLLGGPMYSILFYLLSPQRICAGATGRWATMHQGSTLTLLSSTADSCRMVLETPPHHTPPLIARCYATALQAALEIGGAVNVRFECTTLDASNLQFDGVWSS